MVCPRCGSAMQEHTFDGTYETTVVVDFCEACQALWFDGRESLQLTPGATLALFRVVGEHAARPRLRDADVAKCPRCGARLRRTSDRQRATAFEYLKCPHEHGRFISVLEFLKEKDFIRPPSDAQLTELRQHLQTINCGNCGSPVDLARGAACGHCGSPLSMIDLAHAERLIERLRAAAGGAPAVPLERAPRASALHDSHAPNAPASAWYADVAASGLVGAGLHVVLRWLGSRP